MTLPASEPLQHPWLVGVLAIVVIAGVGLATLGLFVTVTDWGGEKKRIVRAECMRLASSLDCYAMSSVSGAEYPGPTGGFSTLVRHGIIAKEPVDPWGQPYRWTLIPRGFGEDQKAAVWSCGPNMTDEQGGGDDITSE